MKRLLTPLLLLLGACPLARAGHLFTYKSTDAADGKESTITLSVEGDDLRWRKDGGSFDVLFQNGAKPILYMLDEKEKLAVGVDEATIKIFDEIRKQRVAMVEAERDRMMESVEPGRRRMIEHIYENRIPRLPPEKKLKIEPTMAHRTIDGYSTRRFIVYADDKRAEEFWAADVDTVPGGAGLKKLAGVLGDFVQRMDEARGEHSALDSSAVLSKFPRVDGFPVLITNWDGDDLKSTVKLVSVEEKTFDADEFRLPSGFKRMMMVALSEGPAPKAKH